MPYFYCEHGHEFGKREDKPFNFCPMCGGKIISECPHCGYPIGKFENLPGFYRFCSNCGKPLFKDKESVVADEKRKTVMKALKYASHDLSFYHGLRVIDLPDVPYSWEIDNLNITKLLDEAISALE